MRTNQCLHLLVPVVDDTLAEVDCTVVVMADDRETDGVDAVFFVLCYTCSTL
jgi:hypothetical protein